MTQVVELQGFGKVEFPDGMTAEQIQAAIERDILPQRRSPKLDAAEYDPASPEYQAKYGHEGPDRLARAGRGAQDVYQGVTQRILQMGDAMPYGMPSVQEIRALAGKEAEGLTDEEVLARAREALDRGMTPDFTTRVNDEVAQYSADRAKQGGGFDAWRMVGNAAATAPVGLAGAGRGVLGRAAAGGTQGAAAGAAQFAPSGSLKETALNTAIGGAAGAAVAPVAGAIADKGVQLSQKIAGWWRGRGMAGASPAELLQTVPELNDLPPAAQRDLIAEAQAMIRSTGALDAEQLARKANIIAQGATPTKAMVTRDPGDWTREANLQKLLQSPDEQLAGVAGTLTKIRQGNDEAFSNRLRAMGSGLPQRTQEAHGQAVMQSLDDLAGATQKQVSELYDQVRAAKGDQLASDARRMFDVWEELKDSPAADPVTEAVKRRLTRLGMLDSQGKLTQQTLTVKQAEGLRQFINQQPNVYGKAQIIRAIDEDVLSGLGEDAFKGARAAAAERFRMLDNPATQRALNALGELNQGKTAQNFIQSQIVNGADQDVAVLVGTISKMPNEQAQAAMGSLRSGVLQHLESKAVNPNSGQFSGAKLSTALRQIGDEKLLRILGPQMYKDLRNLARAGVDATYEPPYSAVNHSNTAPMLMSLLQRARAVPGVPLLVNEQAEKAAARAGYDAQLREALAARSRGQLPRAEYARRVGEVLTATSAPAGVATLNQARKPADKKGDQRN